MLWFVDIFLLSEWEHPVGDLDNVIGDMDVRYFLSSDSSNVQDMESAVLENPDDKAMWIKLAYKKLSDTQRWGSYMWNIFPLHGSNKWL
jgi:capsule polysaccharide export protein KpsC/LpsZ